MRETEAFPGFQNRLVRKGRCYITDSPFNLQIVFYRHSGVFMKFISTLLAIAFAATANLCAAGFRKKPRHPNL